MHGSKCACVIGFDTDWQFPGILLDKKYASKSQIEKIDAKVKDKVKECEKFAEDSPYPDKSLLYDAVYEQKDYPFLKHKL